MNAALPVDNAIFSMNELASSLDFRMLRAMSGEAAAMQRNPTSSDEQLSMVS